MLIHASGPIYPNFSLFTFGGSCHYVIQNETGCVLIDPGLSVHTKYLCARLNTECDCSPKDIGAILITHLHPERVAAIPYLKQLSPDIKVYGTELMRDLLKDENFVRKIYNEDLMLSAKYEVADRPESLDFDSFSSFLKIDEILPKDNLTVSNELYIRIIPAPGHTEESTAYIIEPYDFLVIDEGAGYFRGKDMASPGGDWSLVQNISTLQNLKDIEFSAICFPNEGVITGQLVQNHIQAIIQNCTDLLKESSKSTIPEEEMESNIAKAFYTSSSRDPLLHYTLERTHQAIVAQLLKAPANE
jgi:glyoxylase-like metal-dependent hydrolase (beta-lactamase superfamily II)